MNQITKDLKDKITQSVLPILTDMRSSGASDDSIKGFLNNYIKSSMKRFYENQTEGHFESIGSIGRRIIEPTNTKAESIFYEKLTEAGLKFNYQYKIGQYRADYFFKPDLVVELDGPVHLRVKHKEHDEKRDKYLKQKGYRTLRVPLEFLAIAPGIVVDEIRSLIQ
ncbi:MAG: endonuclease domain-containing protein [Magnetococcus sp. WYHC-3]